MSSGGSHHHRSSEKAGHKSFKGHSKRAESSKGRVDRVALKSIGSIDRDLSKSERLHRAKQIQQNKRNEVMKKKRLGSRFGPPKIVALVAMNDTVDLNAVASLIGKHCQSVPELPSNVSFIRTLKATVEKKEMRFTFVQCTRDPVMVADVAKVADVIYFVTNPSDPDDPTLAVDMTGNHFMQLVKAQGLPTIFGVTQGISRLDTQKRQQAVSKLATKYFEAQFDEDTKTFPCDNDADITNLLRWTAIHKQREVVWRDERAHLLAEHLSFTPDQTNSQSSGNGDDTMAPTGRLTLTGFLRGNRGLSANQLVHITGVGDFPISSIHGLPENATIIKRKQKGGGDVMMLITATPSEGDDMGEANGTKTQSIVLQNDTLNAQNVYFNNLTLLSSPGPDKESMEGLLPLSSLATTNEQSHIGEDELAEAVRNNPSHAATSSMFSVGADGHVKVNEQGNGIAFNSWSSQDAGDMPYVASTNTFNTTAGLAKAGSGLNFVHGRTIDEENKMLRDGGRQGTGEGIEDEEEGDGIMAANALSSDLIHHKNVWDDLDVSDDDEGSGMDGDDHEERGRGITKSLAKGLGMTGMGEDEEEEVEEEKEAGIISDEDEEGSDGEGAFTAADLKKMKSMARRERTHDQSTAEGKRLAEWREEMGDNSDAMSTISNMSVRTMGGTSTGVKFGSLKYHEKVAHLLALGEKGEDRLVKEKKKLERDEQLWPDEVDVDRDVSLKERFGLYRGLKSYKHAYWNPTLNLPSEYGRISQFANFPLSMKNAKLRCDVDDLPEDLDPMSAQDRLVRPGRAFHVTFTIDNFPTQSARVLMTSSTPALIWGLFKYERKVTVLHLNVKRHEEFELPVRMHDPMHIQVGFRRFQAYPVFSVPVPGSDKSSVTRFMPRGKFFLASMYGRVTFTPAPALMFCAKVLGSYKHEFPFNPLVASGSLAACNPRLLLIKRAVLTGYPIQVFKHSAVVRYMFYNSDDVRWFKSVELWTKSGRQGHITEPRGTHGLFKCSFNGVVHQNDTICMSLYKRQFPPWFPHLFDN